MPGLDAGQAFGFEAQTGSGPASHSVSNRDAPWMAVRRNSPSPVFVKAWASPGGLITTWPASTTTDRGPIWNVAVPDSTMKTSVGVPMKLGPDAGLRMDEDHRKGNLAVVPTHKLV